MSSRDTLNCIDELCMEENTSPILDYEVNPSKPVDGYTLWVRSSLIENFYKSLWKRRGGGALFKSPGWGTNIKCYPFIPEVSYEGVRWDGWGNELVLEEGIVNLAFLSVEGIGEPEGRSITISGVLGALPQKIFDETLQTIIPKFYNDFLRPRDVKVSFIVKTKRVA